MVRAGVYSLFSEKFVLVSRSGVSCLTVNLESGKFDFWQGLIVNKFHNTCGENKLLVGNTSR